MITINMTLFPQGCGLMRQEIITGSIWTTDDLRHHAYHIVHGDEVYSGKLPKKRSGHRNPFHLLQGIMNAIVELIGPLADGTGEEKISEEGTHGESIPENGL